MPKVTFVEANGTPHALEADSGETLRDIAINNDVPGIDGECGGACACATCHVYVDDAWRDKLVAPSEEEIEMLDGAFEIDERSRLSCQILTREDLDGLLVTLAPGSEPG